MQDLKQEWIDDLNEKIKFLVEYPSKPEHHLSRSDEEIKQYLLSTIEKVKQLKQNPSTREDKQLWLKIIKELRSDFGFNHNSRNETMGRSGELLLEYLWRGIKE